LLEGKVEWIVRIAMRQAGHIYSGGGFRRGTILIVLRFHNVMFLVKRHGIKREGRKEWKSYKGM
jgi:hypothetical protein